MDPDWRCIPDWKWGIFHCHVSLLEGTQKIQRYPYFLHGDHPPWRPTANQPQRSMPSTLRAPSAPLWRSWPRKPLSLATAMTQRRFFEKKTHLKKTEGTNLRQAFKNAHQSKLGGGFNDFLFSPRTLGKWCTLTNIIQMGWNYHLEHCFFQRSLGCLFEYLEKAPLFQ